MKECYIKDFMVPLSEYATVSKEGTLKDAVEALEKAQESFDQSRYRHRAVLVFDENDQVVGKISQLDILKALEPKYAEIGLTKGMAKFGFGQKFIQTLQEQFMPWVEPLKNLKKRADELKVKEFMYTPKDGEYVDENDTLQSGIHRLVVGHHQSLLVTKGAEIVGVLRVTDVFSNVFNMIFRAEE
ncbi:MAG: CBS domain-containing protein [Deltaproteobacteria bacterium]|nr:CBS domain-containing protein [Deltaproteobacteria bacterium]